MHLTRAVFRFPYLIFALLLGGVAFVVPILLNYDSSVLGEPEGSWTEQLEKAAGVTPLTESNEPAVRVWVPFVWLSDGRHGDGFAIERSGTTRFSISGPGNLKRYAVTRVRQVEIDNQLLLEELQREIERSDGLRWRCVSDAQDYHFETARDGVLLTTSFQYDCEETPAALKRALDLLYATPQLAL